MAFKLKSSGSYYVTFDDTSLTADRIYQLPNVSGSLLTSNSTGSFPFSASYAVSASYVIGGGGGGLGTPTAVITKTADETVTNSTTLQADDHLTWNGFTSGKSYYIELKLLVSRTNTSAAPGIKYGFNGNSNGYISTVLADGTSNTSGNVNTNGGIPRPFPIQISLVMTSNYTGSFLFAQNTLDSGTGITVHKGSQMLIWEVA